MRGIIDGMTKLLARAMCAAFMLGTIPILVDAPAAMAQISANKPDKPEEPRGDGCIPVGVTKSSTGAVYAIEDCHGVRYQRRMDK